MQRKRNFWKKHKKFYCIVALTAIVLFLLNAGCGSLKENVNKGHETSDGDLSDYNSPYTCAEKLDDGTYYFYIYASPVQWKREKQYQKPDNRLIESKKKDYGFENGENQLKIYFPSGKKKGFRLESEGEYFYMEIPQLTETIGKQNYKNIYGEEKEAVCYSLKNGGQLYAYPISSGIHFECVCPDGVPTEDMLTMKVEKQRLRSDEISDEYLQFFQNGIKILLYQPFIKQGEGDLEQLKVWNLKKDREHRDKDLEVTMSKASVNQEGETCLEFTLLWDREAMPDSTVYEKKNENVFCARSALVGEGKKTGIGQHYLRYRFNYFYQINPEDILKSEYYVKSLNGNQKSEMLSLHAPVAQWSSTKLCWDARVPYEKGSQNQSVNLTEDGWYCFDITDFTKRAVEDYSGCMESYGSVIICEEGSALLATSDNGEFIPYIRLHLKNRPEHFTEHESINETDW